MDIGHSPRHWQRVAALQCAHAELELATHLNNHATKQLIVIPQHEIKDHTAGTQKQ